MRLKQTARKSTSGVPRGIIEAMRNARARGVPIHNPDHIMYLDQDEDNENREEGHERDQVNVVRVEHFYPPQNNHRLPNNRVTPGRNNFIHRERPHVRPMARKSTGPDPFYLPRAIASSTNQRSKNVQKRREDEVSPGGSRTANGPTASTSSAVEPTSSDDVNQAEKGDSDEEDEPTPSTSTGVTTSTRVTRRQSREQSKLAKSPAKKPTKK